jgi:PAS domain S-box-containing protein
MNEMSAARQTPTAAVHRFTDRLYRAVKVEEAYEGALDAIAEAIGCKRAAILVFDDAGIARFVAWRGLSEGYRKAVDGHCPWKPGDRDPAPIFIEDIENVDESEALKATIRAENIRGLAFVPLVGSGGAIGKFMTYYEEPHVFTKEEAALSIMIARQLGFSVDRWQAEHIRQAADDVRGRLAAIVESSDDAIISKDLNGRIMSWNEAAEHLFGYLSEEAIGKSITMLIPEGHMDEETHIIGRIRRGERVQHYETVRQRKDGSLIDISLTVSPIRNLHGEVIGASKIARDISDRRRADEHKTLLIHELNHRVKNTLATVQSLALQSLRDGQSSGRDDFEGRLIALARAHDILTNENWQGAWLEDVAGQAMEAFSASENRVTLQGPAVRLTAKQSLAISMALHELATNAAKYGALSDGKGRVAIAWHMTNGPAPARLHLVWTEEGGPPVGKPTKQGFGSRMISRSLANELAGTAELEFRPEGVVCSISTPIGWGAVGLSPIVAPRPRAQSL